MKDASRHVVESMKIGGEGICAREYWTGLSYL